MIRRDLEGQEPGTELESTLDQFRELTALLARKVLEGPGTESIHEHQARLAEWQARKDALEAALARRVPHVHLALRLQTRASARELADAFGADSALVEIVRFDVAHLAEVPPGERPSDCYAAFVLCSGEPEQLSLIDLGDAEQIDGRIEDFRSRLLEPAKGGGDWLKAARALRQSIFDPLVPALRGRTRIFLAPDGEVNLVPFGRSPPSRASPCSVPTNLPTWVAGAISSASGTAPPAASGPPVVVAAPDFDLGTGSAEEGGTETRDGWQQTDLFLGMLDFSPLPGARLEGEQVAALLGVEPWLGEHALEARLKNYRSPRILHISTHGFTLLNTLTQKDAEGKYNIQTGIDWAGRSWRQGQGRLSGPGTENPMLRAGLALAGVRRWLAGGCLPEEAEDGLLMAEDVLGMDLRGTELVVLSGCDTGRGDVHVGEGVFGLQRAFLLAGAEPGDNPVERDRRGNAGAHGGLLSQAAGWDAPKRGALGGSVEATRGMPAPVLLGSLRPPGRKRTDRPVGCRWLTNGRNGVNVSP